MKPIESKDLLITSYVLGEVTEEERGKIEELARQDSQTRLQIDIAEEFSQFLEDSLFPTNEHRLSGDHLSEIRRRGRKGEKALRRELLSKIGLSQPKVVRFDSNFNKRALVGVSLGLAAFFVGVTLLLINIEVGGHDGGVVRGGEKSEQEWPEFHIRLVEPFLEGSNQGKSSRTITSSPKLTRSEITNYYEEDSVEETLLAGHLDNEPKLFSSLLRALASPTESAELRQEGAQRTLTENTDKGSEPKSVVSVNSETPSFSCLEHYVLEKGELPPRDTIRVEQLVNHLKGYELSSRHGQLEIKGVHLRVELAICPWNENSLLAAVQLSQASRLSNTSLEELPIVRFVPRENTLNAYRLIGYGKKGGAQGEAEEHRGEGEMLGSLARGAHNLAFYELHLKKVGGEPLFSLELCASHSDPRELGSLHIYAEAPEWKNASVGFRLASLLCASALELRDASCLVDLDSRRLIEKLEALEKNEPLKLQEGNTVSLIKEALILKLDEDQVMSASIPLKKKR